MAFGVQFYFEILDIFSKVITIYIKNSYGEERKFTPSKKG